MNTPSLPSIALVAHADTLIALFGQFNLYDAELRGIRLAVGHGGVPTLEADFIIPGELALPTGRADRARDYRVTLRCTDVVDLALADFADQNVVVEYAFEPLGADAPDERAVHVSVTAAPGCDFDLRCRAVAVVAVDAIDVA